MIDRIRRAVEPRHPQMSRRTEIGFLIVGISALVTLMALQVVAMTPAAITTWWCVGISWAVLLIALLLTDADSPRARLLWPLVPSCGVIAIAALLITEWERTRSGLLFVALPVMVPAFQLRPWGARIVLGTALATSLVVIGLKARTAYDAIEVLLVDLALILMSTLITRTVDENERLLDAVRTQASHDALTGLVVRRVLDDQMAQTLGSRPEHGVALVLVDLDNFKQINDSHGHPVGDAALQHIAAVLEASVHDVDAVASRIGGDELAILLRDCTVEAAQRRAGDLVTAVRSAPLYVEGVGDLALTVSVGVAHAPDHANDVRSIYSAADQALYIAKRNGRDQHAAFSETDRARPAEKVRQPTGVARPESASHTGAR